MGFTDFSSDSGLALANHFFRTRSYVEGYTPTQADVVTFKAFQNAPDAAKYPHAARWYKHIASYESEFTTLKGDPSRSFTSFGPETTDIPVIAKKPAEEDDDDMDLFGSDEDDEDAELIAQREKNLAEYRKKAATKAKPPAQSFVTIAIKPMSSKTPMRALAKGIRELLKETDGVTYSYRQFEPIGYGVYKLLASFVVEDDKVSIDALQDKIEEKFGEESGFEVKNDVPLKDGVKVKNEDPEGDEEDKKRNVGKDGVGKDAGEDGLFGKDEDKPEEVKGEKTEDDDDEDEDDDGWVQSTDIASMQKK